MLNISHINIVPIAEGRLNKMSNSFEIKCNVCEGKGKRQILMTDDFEWTTKPITCYTCNGTGKQVVKFKGYEA